MQQTGNSSRLSKPDKSSFLILFLKAMKDCIVLYESGIEFYSFGAVNCHDLGLYVEELAIGRFNIAFPLRSSLLLGCPSGKAKSKNGGYLLGNFPPLSVQKSLKTKVNSQRARTPVFLVYFLQKAKANNQSVNTENSLNSDAIFFISYFTVGD